MPKIRTSPRPVFNSSVPHQTRYTAQIKLDEILIILKNEKKHIDGVSRSHGIIFTREGEVASQDLEEGTAIKLYFDSLYNALMEIINFRGKDNKNV